MVAAVGDDLFGRALRENFTRLGIDASRVKTVPGSASGAAPIFVDPTGQNRILVAEGANAALTPGDVDAAESVVKYADAVLLQSAADSGASGAVVDLPTESDGSSVAAAASAFEFSTSNLSGGTWVSCAVSVANTTMNQTGQAVEGIALIMAVYLVISLLISLFMNLYNRSVALVER